jgi:hypothetical protein
MLCRSGALQCPSQDAPKHEARTCSEEVHNKMAAFQNMDTASVEQRFVVVRCVRRSGSVTFRRWPS